MAIDTKAKRMSMLSFASPLAWGHHFEVDGAVDADDRAHLLHIYGGNALAGVSPPVFSGTIPDQTATVGISIDFDLSVFFAGADTYSIAPAVEAGE